MRKIFGENAMKIERFLLITNLLTKEILCVTISNKQEYTNRNNSAVHSVYYIERKGDSFGNEFQQKNA